MKEVTRIDARLGQAGGGMGIKAWNVVARESVARQAKARDGKGIEGCFGWARVGEQGEGLVRTSRHGRARVGRSGRWLVKAMRG